MNTLHSREFENAIQEKRVELFAAQRRRGRKVDGALIAEVDAKAVRIVRRQFVYKNIPGLIGSYGMMRILVRKDLTAAQDFLFDGA